MGRPAYLVKNLVEEPGVTLTASDADSNYPLANLKDRVRARPFKFVTSGSVWIEVDFGASYDSYSEFNTVALIGHTIDDTGDCTINGGPTSNPLPVRATFRNRQPDLWVSTAATINRFVRININKWTTTNIPSIGELVVGHRTALPRAPVWSIVKQFENSGITHRTYGGVSWDYEYFSRWHFQFGFRFPESEFAQFEAFSRQVGRKPFVWIPDETKSEMFYVKKQRGFAPVPVGPGRDQNANESLLADGGFELGNVGFQPAAWNINSGAPAIVSTDFVHSGAQSAKMTIAAGTSLIAQNVYLIAGVEYELSGWMRIAAHSAQAANVEIRLLSNFAVTPIFTSNEISKSATSISFGFALNGTGHEWTQVSCRFRANASGTSQISLSVSPTATVTVWFDDISLKQYGIPATAGLQTWYDWVLDLEEETIGLAINA